MNRNNNGTSRYGNSNPFGNEEEDFKFGNRGNFSPYSLGLVKFTLTIVFFKTKKILNAFKNE